MSKMLEAMIITLREGIEAALVVGIVYAYLKKIGRDNLNPYLYSGVLLAVLASIIGAAVLQILYPGQETRDQQIFEGTIMVIAAFFVTTMVIWMWRSAKNIKKHIEGSIDRIAKNNIAGISILLFVFLMVFREGAETVLFLYAISFQSNFLYNLSGGILGLILATVFGVLLSRGSLMIDLKKFFAITGSLLLFLVVELIATAIHEFQEARLLMPAGNGILWDIQVWLASPDSGLFTLMPIIVVPSIMIFLGQIKNKENLSQGELRAHIFTKLLAGSLTLFVILFSLSVIASKEPGYDPEPIRVNSVNGEIRIPIENVNENITKYVYNFTEFNVGVRFLLVKASDGSIKSALDACRVCGPRGFEQFGNTVVCRRCGVETEIDDIGKDESCNPIPLESVINSGYVIIPIQNFLRDMYIWTDY